VHSLRLANHQLVWLLIDVATMANCYNHDHQNSVIDGVNDSVIANPKSVTLTPPERPRGRRPWILGEQCDCPLNSRLHRKINLAEFSKCRRPKFNAISVQDQPRSIFTCSQGILSPTSARAASNAATS